MNAKLFSAAAVAATLVLLPLQGRAQTTFTDNANNPAYANGYITGSGANTPGFTPFTVVANGSAGTFVFTAGESEGNNGTPKPSSIDTNGKSFGLYAQNAGASTTITRGFNAPPEASGLATAGDMFSLDFVKGYNDAGTSGVALTDAGGTVGSFVFQSGGTGILFNGAPTGIGFNAGADHLVYTLTSPTAYSLMVTGADTFTGAGTFTSPINGFQVQQTDSGATTPDHNAYFNNLSVTANSPSAAPEPSQMGALVIMGLGLGGLLLRRRMSAAR